MSEKIITFATFPQAIFYFRKKHKWLFAIHALTSELTFTD
jgi:hypothetical protein